MHVHNEINLPQAKLDSEINVRFLLNEHGDLYLLLHNNREHIILFKLKNIGRKKDKMKACTKPLLWDAYYNHENNDVKKALRPHGFK